MGENKYWLAIGVTIFVMALMFYKDKKEITHPKNKNIEFEEKTNNNSVHQSQLVGNSGQIVSADPSIARPIKNSESDMNAQANEQISKQFSAHLKSMTKCFNLPQLQNISEKTDPTPESLLNYLRAGLGDVVVKMDDWAQTEYINEKNERIRIRVDYDYPDGAIAERRLSMFKINSYGAPEIMGLTPDQANNPNEAYIASLTEGQNISNIENGTRAYYSEGEELIYTTINGQLNNLTVSKGERSYNCIGINEDNSNCFCQ